VSGFVFHEISTWGAPIYRGFASMTYAARTRTQLYLQSGFDSKFQLRFGVRYGFLLGPNSLFLLLWSASQGRRHASVAGVGCTLGRDLGHADS
jgi:hypothetical protein